MSFQAGLKWLVHTFRLYYCRLQAIFGWNSRMWKYSPLREGVIRMERELTTAVAFEDYVDQYEQNDRSLALWGALWEGIGL